MQIAMYEENLSDLSALEQLLAQHAVEYSVYSDSNRLLRDINENSQLFELYIVTLESDGNVSLEIAKKIRMLAPNALIVFLTSSKEYMPLVFELRTFDYLIKPITEENLTSVLQRAQHYLALDKKYFHFSYKKINYVLDVDKILYFEKKGRIAYIYHEAGISKSNMTIQSILDQLDTTHFIQIHSAYVVNLTHIKGYTFTYILIEDHFHNAQILINNSEERKLPISRRYKKSTKRSIQTFFQLEA
ncbi:hypothetical protein BAU15_05990 [Enterococcus sp. JM4C]|uniref:LytR/AlgR family response regulator transcription factor n=1 Tax=Candidatus Enterococcus huntleyi TaxID=1857217 RepID=UPI00137AA437|nr:LytTR family DNA-binding domain-containing protein [Enterococcus sp. JM4C]KAF1297100.1 hypothetical protein BAU15_05990 [Enterococcus sp. JM4C]